MAAPKTASTQKSKTAKATEAAPSPRLTEEDVIAATFAIIAEKGYGKTRLSLIADMCDVDLVDLYEAYPTVDAIIMRFLDRIDREMLENAVPEGLSDKRDLYFDMMMSRFDTAQEHREGMVRWLNDLSKLPTMWPMYLRRWDQSLSLMLDVAKDSPVFPIKKIGLAAIYGSALRAWLKDDTDDLEKTMVAVDQALEKGGAVVERFLTRKKPV